MDTKSAKQTLFTIDASIYIFQSYFSFPDSFYSKSGRPINAVYGYTLWLCKFLLQVQPSLVNACFDESLESGFRHRIDPSYKSNRVLPDMDLAYQLIACKKITSLFGIPSLASNEYEADDLIASSARLASCFDINSCIISRDKDLAQLLHHESSRGAADNTIWHFPAKEKMTSDSFYLKYQIQARYMADFLAIVGDTSDFIQGVPGIGAKTVAALFKAFPGWPTLRDNLHLVANLPLRGVLRVQSLLEDHVDLIEKNMRLTTLVDTIFMPSDDVDLLENFGLLEVPDLLDCPVFLDYSGISEGMAKKQALFEDKLIKRNVDEESLLCLFDEFDFPDHLYKSLEKIKKTQSVKRFTTD